MGRVHMGREAQSSKRSNNAKVSEEIKAPIEIRTTVYEVIEKPVDRIVEKFNEVIVEKIVYVDRPIEIPIQVIKEVEVIREIRIPGDVLMVEKEVEVIKEVEKIVNRDIKMIPLWVKGLVILESLLILLLIIK